MEKIESLIWNGRSKNTYLKKEMEKKTLEEIEVGATIVGGINLRFYVIKSS